MKKTIFIAILLPLVMGSCEMNPEAYFSATPGDPVVGEEVLFTNNSIHAESCEWDFGDGYISNEIHPSHVYSASGTFTVILKVWSAGGLTDEAVLDIIVKIPTLLEIEVLEYYDEYPVEGASVVLYPTLDDWDNETNMIYEGFTDGDGKVVFSHLERAVYYTDIWEATHDNYALRDEDVGFIRTPEILPNKINRFIAYVDYVDHGKGTGRRSSNIVIKRLERKMSDKRQAIPYPGDSDWKELYEKSVRVR